MSSLYPGVDVDAFLSPTFDVKEWVNGVLTPSRRPRDATGWGRASQSEEPREADKNEGFKTAGEPDVEPFVGMDDAAGDDAREAGAGAPFSDSGETGGRSAGTSAGYEQTGTGAGTEAPSIDQLASTLVLKLQLLSQEVSSKLDKLSDEAIRNMPRVLYDFELLRKDVHSVRSAVEDAKRQFETAEGGNNAFQDLVRLDTVRTRMELTRHSLREAENWSTLSAEMEAIFAARDYEKAATRLEEARRSLALLSSTPDYEDRRALLAKLQNQLESDVKPKVLAALNEHDAEATKRYYRIFSKMEKSTEFANHYYRARRAPLLRLWQQYDQDPSVRSAEIRGDKTFADWLAPFYEEVFLVLNKEFSWSAYIFPSPIDVLQALVHHTFSALKPTLADRCAEVAARLHEGCLPVIIKAYQTTVAFGQKVERLMLSEADRPASPGGDIGSPYGSPVSVDGGNDIAGWGFVIYESFMPFQQDFANYEKNHLTSLSSVVLKPERNADFMEIAQTMGDSVAKIFNFAEMATVRCRQLTFGFGLPGLVDCLNEFFGAVIDRYSALLEQIRQETGVDGTQISSMGDEEDDDDYELGRGEVGRQEWGHFQVAVRVLGMCPVITRRLEGFPLSLKKVFGGLRSRLELGASCQEYYAEDKERTEECFSALTLLKLSSLNSYTLHTVLGTLEAIEKPAEPRRSGAVRKTPREQEPAAGDSPAPTPPARSQSTLFAPSFEGLRLFTSSSQRFVFDTMFATVEKHLSAVPNMDVWRSAAPTTSGPFNLEVPQFSLSPSPYITCVGEHLLTIPQQLELHPDEEALSYSLETLPFLEPEDFREEEASLGEDGDEMGGDGLGNGGNEADRLTADLVTNLWITAVSRGTMVGYADTILKIPKLSEHGAKQLATDISYIINVFAAMDIEPVTKLRGVLQLVTMDGVKLERWREGSHQWGENEGFVDESTVKRIAAIRGLLLDSK
ncbi:hypothetical protein HK104_009482 [Borealophlyctis nickersoniae]|nr:hypothetical protein HK104_009482 [Borealophlyctis nickersoniae]